MRSCTWSYAEHAGHSQAESLTVSMLGGMRHRFFLAEEQFLKDHSRELWVAVAAAIIYVPLFALWVAC